MAKTPTVSKKTAGKIGLIGSISIIISTVVGVGVFFKNGSVFSNNSNWAPGIMISWGLAIIIALFTAFSFAEIVTVKGMRNPDAGLAGWSEKMVGYNFGRHVSITQSTFYYAAKFVAMGTYAAVSIFIVYFAAAWNTEKWGTIVKFSADLLGAPEKYTTLITMSLAVVLIAIFLIANYFSSKFGQVVSKGATVIKFIPILMVAFIGIIAGAIFGTGIWKNATLNTSSTATALATLNAASNATAGERVNGIFKSIPAILFAFDSFLVIGNVSKNVENPEKNVPLAIIISMIVAAVFQILITIGCITAGTGNPFELLKKLIWEKAGSKVGYIITATILSVSLVTATLGVLSSYSVAGTKATQALVDEETIVGYRWAKPLSQKHDKLGGLLIYVIFISIVFLGIAIPSCILNTSQIYDGFSTLVVLFYFGIYGTTILGGLVNRKTGKNQVKKVGYFMPFGIIGVIGCYFAFGYTAFYQFLVQVAMNPTDYAANSFGFGMVKEGYYVSEAAKAAGQAGFNNWQAALVFWSAAIFFLGFPFLNDLILVTTDRHYPHRVMWESEKKFQSYKIVSKK